MNFNKVEFILSAYRQGQCPETELPEIAFAGRSNVGKSSLINRLVRRNNLVKTSSKPGKTQSINFFLLDQALHLVDLPGYGFARVSKKVKQDWQDLITQYLCTRKQLVLVVVIVDLRHEPKQMDQMLINWLRQHALSCHLVYTKADKLSRSKQIGHAVTLDIGLNVQPHERTLFSAANGQGVAELQGIISQYCSGNVEPVTG